MSVWLCNPMEHNKDIASALGWGGARGEGGWGVLIVISRIR